MWIYFSGASHISFDLFSIYLSSIPIPSSDSIPCILRQIYFSHVRENQLFYRILSIIIIYHIKLMRLSYVSLGEMIKQIFWQLLSIDFALIKRIKRAYCRCCVSESLIWRVLRCCVHRRHRTFHTRVRERLDCSPPAAGWFLLQ